MHALAHPPRIHSISLETDAMSKSHETHKETKKKPQKSAHDKRLGKRIKKSSDTLLGSHGTMP